MSGRLHLGNEAGTGSGQLIIFFSLLLNGLLQPEAHRLLPQAHPEGQGLHSGLALGPGHSLICHLKFLFLGLQRLVPFQSVLWNPQHTTSASLIRALAFHHLLFLKPRPRRSAEDLLVAFRSAGSRPFSFRTACVSASPSSFVPHRLVRDALEPRHHLPRLPVLHAGRLTPAPH